MEVEIKEKGITTSYDNVLPTKLASKGKVMTLIIYLRCKDGCILISDREESSDFGQSSEVQKNYLAKKKDFALAGGGDGWHIDSLITKLNGDDGINGQNVVEKSLSSYRNILRSMGGIELM